MVHECDIRPCKVTPNKQIPADSCHSIFLWQWFWTVLLSVNIIFLNLQMNFYGLWDSVVWGTGVSLFKHMLHTMYCTSRDHHVHPSVDLLAYIMVTTTAVKLIITLDNWDIRTHIVACLSKIHVSEESSILELNGQNYHTNIKYDWVQFNMLY